MSDEQASQEETTSDGHETEPGLGELVFEGVQGLIAHNMQGYQEVVRQVVREEIAKLLDVEETAVAMCLRELHAGMDKRLGEIEKACGLIVDHATFMERCLVKVTECAQRPDSPEAEEWRQSLGDDAG